MKKDVIFLLTEGFADWESAFLSSMISNGGLNKSEPTYNVRTLSKSKEPVRSFGGFLVIPEYDKLPDEYAGLILLGGSSWKTKSCEWVKPIIEDALHKNIIIGAICDATFFLANNGFLNTIPHTSNELEDLKLNAKNYEGEKYYKNRQTVWCNNIITANGTAYLEFTRDLLIRLNVDNENNIHRFYELYKKGQFPE